LVACKKIFRALIKGDAMQEYLSETRILRRFFVLTLQESLAQCICRVRHPNIVLFMGAFANDGECGILTEYVRRGSLADVLQVARSVT
jgi:hypothetical protein